MGFPHELSDLIYPDIGQGRQPQYALNALDSDNPATKTITYCFPLNGDFREIISGEQLTITNGFEAVDGRGVSLAGTGTNSCASIPLNLSFCNKLTISFWMYWPSFANDDKFALEFTSDTNTTVGGFNVGPNSSYANHFLVYARMFDAGRGRDYARPSVGWHHYSIGIDLSVPSNSGNAVLLYIDGNYVTQLSEVFPGTFGSGYFANSTLYLFSRNNASLFGAGRMQNLIIRGGVLPVQSEIIAEFTKPWELYKAPNLGSFVPAAAGGSNLAASASGSDTTGGSANLSAAVALSAVGVSVAGGSAALKASIPLSAAGISIASGSAGGGVTVSITAAGLAQSAGSAGLSVAVLLAAAGAAYASGNAVLGARLQAIATGGASASGSATLSGGAIGSISAAGLAQAAGSATLAASVYLAGIGAATAAGNATLAAQLNALATGAAQAGGSANLTGGAPGALSASGSASAGGSAALSINVQLAATGSSQASGAANGSASAPGALSASGQANASGSATWSTLVTLTAAGFVQAMGAGAFTVTVPLSAAGHAQAGGTAHAVLLGTVLNFYLRPSVMRLATLDCSGRRLTTLLHEVLHA